MSNWVQKQHPEGALPYVVEHTSGVTNWDYPIGILCISTLAHQPCVQVIFIADIDGKVLIAVPGSVWNVRKAQRILPNNWVTKATSMEVVACGFLDREVPMEDLTLPIWVGFIKQDLIARVDFSRTEVEVEYVFEGECLGAIVPFADSLTTVANEHFSFVSASDRALAETEAQIVEGGEEEEHGSTDVSSRISALESMMHALSENVQKLVSSRPAPKRQSALRKPGTAPTTPAPRVKIVPAATAKSGPPTPSPEEFPFLDASVVAAGLQAGVSRQVLQQMSRLASRNPKATKTADINPSLTVDPLSEDEDPLGVFDDIAESGVEAQPVPPVVGVEAAVLKLTDIVQTMNEDRKKRGGGSRLDSALDHVGAGSSADTSSIGTGRRNAAARRALRSMLTDQPSELYGLIERLMWEDINSQTLVPGVCAPAFSVRSWMEHRSRITAYRTLAFGAWGVAGALDCLIQGNAPAARARLAILMMQYDQSSIDQGSWYLAAELGLEHGPPFSALEQHKGPNTMLGEAPYSRILDPRWAEIAMSHLRDQEDFVNKRKNLGKTSTAKEAEEEASTSPRRRAKAKAKAKAAADPAA